MKRSVNNNCLYTVFCYYLVCFFYFGFHTLTRRKETHFQNKIMVGHNLFHYVQNYIVKSGSWLYKAPCKHYGFTANVATQNFKKCQQLKQCQTGKQFPDVVNT